MNITDVLFGYIYLQAKPIKPHNSINFQLYLSVPKFWKRDQKASIA